jgi:hypothetical protein
VGIINITLGQFVMQMLRQIEQDLELGTILLFLQSFEYEFKKASA